MKHISVQVEDELWQAARLAAVRQNTTLTEVIRAALAAFVEKEQGQQHQAPEGRKGRDAP